MAYNDTGHAAPTQTQDQAHPHMPPGSPRGGQFAKKGTRGGGRSTPTRVARPVPRPSARPVAHAVPTKAATPLKGPRPRMKRGLNNDPARVKELQGLVRQLKLGNPAVDGQFGTATEAAVMNVQRRLGLKPTGIASASLVDKLKAASALSPCVGHVAAAAGIDTHPGDAARLKAYWLTGKGQAKWVPTLHPWTSLYRHLVKFMPPEEAKRTAAQWFHDHFGFWPGADLNRVTHGKPPRGHRVGPG